MLKNFVVLLRPFYWEIKQKNERSFPAGFGDVSKATAVYPNILQNVLKKNHQTAKEKCAFPGWLVSGC